MPLRVTIDIVDNHGFTNRRASEFFIGRLEEFKGNDWLHKYEVSRNVRPWVAEAAFSHKYSDGADVCVMKAIEALEREEHDS